MAKKSFPVLRNKKRFANYNDGVNGNNGDKRTNPLSSLSVKIKSENKIVNPQITLDIKSNSSYTCNQEGRVAVCCKEVLILPPAQVLHHLRYTIFIVGSNPIPHHSIP